MPDRLTLSARGEDRRVLGTGGTSISTCPVASPGRRAPQPRAQASSSGSQHPVSSSRHLSAEITAQRVGPETPLDLPSLERHSSAMSGMLSLPLSGLARDDRRGGAAMKVRPGAVIRGAGVALACLVPDPSKRSPILLAGFAGGWFLNKPGLQVFTIIPDADEPWKRATVPFATSVASWSTVMLAATTRGASNKAACPDRCARARGRPRCDRLPSRRSGRGA